MDKIILDLCGGTGAWSKPYRDANYDVRLITLPNNDVRTYMPPNNVYGILAAPPCTMFSFARTHAKTPRDMRGGMEIVIACLRIIWECQYKIKGDTQRKPPLKFWALENPNGMLNWLLGNPFFTFNPYEFGDKYSKKTCLWGYFNKPIKTHVLSKSKYGKFDQLRMDELREIRRSEINSISDIIWKQKNRQELRSITPQGFARSFFWANQ